MEVGRIKFDAPEKPMKIDGHPFPAITVEVKDQDAKTGAKVLTSERAKRSGAMDPQGTSIGQPTRGAGPIR